MIRKLLLAFALGVALFAVLAAALINRELNTPFLAGAEPEVFVEVPRGAAASDAARILAEAGIIRHAVPFLAYTRWKNLAGRIQAGEYRFAQPATPPEVIDRLVRGDVYYRVITLPEGLTAAETIERLSQAGLGKRYNLDATLRRTDWVLDLAPEAKSLEGFLFPDTYRFGRRAGAEQILGAMVQRFRERWSELRKRNPSLREEGALRIVTLASLVEKESGDPKERPVVASVLENRLQKKMPLACDPTIIYALKQRGSFDGNLRKTDLMLDSPYNTYRHAGLPPGPIANPGMNSLAAAVGPARTDFLYYVSKNDGTHFFSKDYRSHQEAVRRYQKTLPRRK